MDLFERISKDIVSAMKAKDKNRLDALRNVKKLFLEAKTSPGANDTLTDETAMKIMQKLVKQGKDSADIYVSQNRQDLADDTAITVVGAFTANMAFDRNAFLLASRTPAMPEGGDNADDVMNVTDPISGITFQIALYRQYRQVRYEVGLAWGVSSVKPAHGCLILG